MELGLKGKTAIVTGGGSNIGRGISLALGAEGINVVIADYDQKQGEKTAGEIVAKGGTAICIKTDITKYPEVEAMVNQTLGKFNKIDILVNNVGWDEFGFFVDTKPASWDKIIDINYKGMLNCCKAVLPGMIQKKSGSIVSISSDSARVGGPREAVYSGCKGAMMSVTKTIARENGRFGIRMNVVSAGATPPKPEEIGELSMHYGRPAPPPDPARDKEMLRLYPLGRVGTAQDLANAVVFLASDAASFITGQTISVSGGYSMV
jgi:2-hydroxycyclohexanecarboxyl-CoA dehydrogenase